METFSALLVICAQRPVTRSFDVFFDLRPYKREAGDFDVIVMETV